MLKTSMLSDRLAMALSGLCVLHCFALPAIILLLPSSITAFVSDESFHIGMLMTVIPVSFFALISGYRQHRRESFIILGSIGIGFLMLAVTIIENLLGGVGEKSFTLLGAVLVAYAHCLNFKHCKDCKEIQCTSATN